MIHFYVKVQTSVRFLGLNIFISLIQIDMQTICTLTIYRIVMKA